jgi:hypothetical protein
MPSDIGASPTVQCNPHRAQIVFAYRGLYANLSLVEEAAWE